MIEVVCIPALGDNYIWMLHDPDGGETVVVDPGEAAPVLAEAKRRGWTIGQIWNTHWHPDHVAGNGAIKAATGCTITGPAAEAEKIGALDRQVAEGDRVTIGRLAADVIAIPAHTAGHIGFHLAEATLLFPGDTIFAMGCGRLFEGTPAQMFAALRRIAALPEDTFLYGAHEYTLGNGRFAMVAEPENLAIAARMEQVEAARAAGRPTLPTTVREERATNPFVRAADVATLAALREAKDAFRG